MNDCELIVMARREDDMRAFMRAERLGLTLHETMPDGDLGRRTRVMAWRNYFQREATARFGMLEAPGLR